MEGPSQGGPAHGKTGADGRCRGAAQEEGCGGVVVVGGGLTVLVHQAAQQGHELGVLLHAGYRGQRAQRGKTVMVRIVHLPGGGLGWVGGGIGAGGRAGRHAGRGAHC